MSAISDDILSSLDIVQVISPYVSLKKSGVNFSGLCPFHSEKSPSFVVSPHKQIYKCFGCGQGGNAISFIMEIERYDYWDAIKYIADTYHIDISKYTQKADNRKELGDEKEKFKYMHKLAQDFFKQSLLSSQEATQYLTIQRKLTPEIIQKFGLGYAPKYGGLSQKLVQKSFNTQDIIAGSLAKESTNTPTHGGHKGSTKDDVYDFFRHRITVPIFDQHNNIIAFGARIIDPNDKPKYLNSAESMLYNKSKVLYGMHQLKEQIKKFAYVIIVEGYMDVISLAQGGFPIGLATCGTALTKEHMLLIQRYTDNVYFLFDNDNAGQEATRRGLSIAYNADIYPKALTLPGGHKDIDEMIHHPDYNDTQIPDMIDKAQDGFVYIIQKQLQNLHIQQPSDKQKILRSGFALIQSMATISMQHDYIAILADITQSNTSILFSQYKDYCRHIPKREQNTEDKKHSTPKFDSKTLCASLIGTKILTTYNLDTHPQIQALLKVRHTYQTDILLFFPKELDTSMEIRREQELEKLATQDHKVAYIIKTIGKDIQDIIRYIIKHRKLDGSDSQDLLTQYKKIMHGQEPEKSPKA